SSDVCSTDHSAPAGAAQGVEPTVVADTSVGIVIDEATLLVRFIGEFRPRQGGSGQCGADVDGLFTGIDALAGLDIRVVVGHVSRLRAELCRSEVSDVRCIADGLGHPVSFMIGVVVVLSPRRPNAPAVCSQFVFTSAARPLYGFVVKVPVAPATVSFSSSVL